MDHAFAAFEEMRRSVSAYDRTAYDRREAVVCPKPRRIGLLNTGVNDPIIRPLRCHHPELFESKAGTDLLDIILPKVGYGGEQQSCAQAAAASSPPFFSGSPPSRVSNPLIQDTRFGDDSFSPISPQSIPIPSGSSMSSTSSSARKGGCIRASFGNNPASRIEGFDCLDRDRRNRSVPALA